MPATSPRTDAGAWVVQAVPMSAITALIKQTSDAEGFRQVRPCASAATFIRKRCRVSEFCMMLQNSDITFQNFNMAFQNFNMAFQTSEHGVSKLRTCMLQI